MPCDSRTNQPQWRTVSATVIRTCTYGSVLEPVVGQHDFDRDPFSSSEPTRSNANRCFRLWTWCSRASEETPQSRRRQVGCLCAVILRLRVCACAPNCGKLVGMVAVVLLLYLVWILARAACRTCLACLQVTANATRMTPDKCHHATGFDLLTTSQPGLVPPPVLSIVSGGLVMRACMPVAFAVGVVEPWVAAMAAGGVPFYSDVDAHPADHMPAWVLFITRGRCSWFCYCKLPRLATL